MKYGKLFQVEVLHDYYKDGLCPDFIIEPSDETNRILKNHRLLARSGEYGIDILTPLTSDEKMFLEPEDGLELIFFLRLANPSFLNFTDLEWLTADGIPWFSNKDVDNGENKLKRSVSGQPNSTAFRLSRKVFGIACIYVDRLLLNGFLKQMPKSYKITFNSRKIKWKYYLVTEKSAGKDFKIIDDDSTRNKSPIIFNNIAVGKQQKADDYVSATLERQFPDKEKIVFESVEHIAYSQDARKNLQLKQNDTILIEHLPNPPADLEPYRIIKNIK